MDLGISSSGSAPDGGGQDGGGQSTNLPHSFGGRPSTVPEDPHPILRMRPGLQACEEHEFREFRQCRFLHPCSVRLRKPAYRF